jgi:hypothetical protein
MDCWVKLMPGYLGICWPVLKSYATDAGDGLLRGAEAMQALVKNGFVNAGVRDDVGGEGDGPGGGAFVVTAVTTLGVRGGGEGSPRCRGWIARLRQGRGRKGLRRRLGSRRRSTLRAGLDGKTSFGVLRVSC